MMRPCARLLRCGRARGDITLSYFEFGTLAALILFSRRLWILCVLEVGMGGQTGCRKYTGC